MADASQLQLNPYALFDPSQWANPYSNYQSSALPAASYVGWPTDAMGNPIQAPQGMTINQTPAQPAAAQASQTPNAQWAINNAMLSGQYGNPKSGVPVDSVLTQMQNNNAAYGIGGQGQGPIEAARLAQIHAAQGQSPSAQQAAPAAATGANSAGLTPQQYMALRANPGPIPTYGATVPQASPSQQPGAGVLQSFLQNWKPASSGVGSGFQQGFANALKNQGYRTS